MGKADELLRTMGGAILESASHRGAPAAMPSASTGSATNPDRLAGVTRSKVALEIPLARIGADPDQPREGFEEDALTRLAESIRTKGLLQPISVRWVEGQGRYVIIAGERRWRAATMAGLTSLSCVVVDRPIPPGELLALQCVENLLREDLRPIEQAKAFRTLMDINGWSGNQLAKELGVSQPAVVATLKLLSLPEPVQDLIESGDLPASSASAIASLEHPGDQAKVAARVVAEKLSRAETVEAVRQVATKPKPGSQKGRGVTKGKPKLPTERSIRVDGGLKVTVSGRKGFDLAEAIDALEQAIAKLYEEQGERRGAAGRRTSAVRQKKTAPVGRPVAASRRHDDG